MLLRFDLYSGVSGDKKYTEKDSWIQEPGESVDELADRIRERIIENADQLITDSEGNDDGTDDK